MVAMCRTHRQEARMDSRNEAVLGRQGAGSPEAQVCCLPWTPGPAFALEESISHPNPNIYISLSLARLHLLG